MTGPDFDRLLVTSALPYANGPIHLGHLAGAYLPADIFCRFQRLMGREILYICGSDEHGVPIVLRAREEGVPPEEIVDRYHARIEESFRAFGMSFDHYGRTSSKIHLETSADFFRRLAGRGVFIKKTEAQLFDPEAGLFLADRFVRGTCPSCGHEEAYGDQCENCGTSLSPSELLNPRSAVTKAEPIMKETLHWYLPLGKMAKDLEAWIGTHPEWKPNVLGQVRSWLQEGLSDRAVTRDLPWGVPVPEDAAGGADVKGKVLYVWFDAPIGYVSATREWAEAQGDPELWKRYWQDPGTRLIHFIGKDNIVFHCLIFPAMLKAHGDYVLPENVPSNEFLNLEGGKLSTSRGWAVWLQEFLEAFPADYLRYSLARILPETRDSDFSWKEFQAHVNNELADTLGNLVNRSLTFTARYFEGRVPPLQDPSELDRQALEAMAGFPGRIAKLMEGFRFRDAVGETMALARMGNKYINDSEPWATRTRDPQACRNTIHVALQICASLSILFEPLLPFSCARIRGWLGLEGMRSSTPGGPKEGLGWEDAGRPLLEAGQELGEAEILFRKVEDEAVEAQIARLRSGGGRIPAGGFMPLQASVGFEDFAKLDLRVGEVLHAEKVKKSKKLICAQVDLGMEQRQILAGVAEHLSPEDLIGMRVVVVANLKGRRLMGLESQGMLLMAEDREGRLVPVLAESEPGSRVS